VKGCPQVQSGLCPMDMSVCVDIVIKNPAIRHTCRLFFFLGLNYNPSLRYIIKTAMSYMYQKRSPGDIKAHKAERKG
jgi:hypothetical protein